jgi:UDP-N-acetyl-D-mannosaminuronic acid dehydrogenase
MRSTLDNKKIVIIGGCGHVGLPLGVKLSLVGNKVVLIDTDKEKVRAVMSGRLPFVESGGENQLREALESGLEATSDATACIGADAFVFVTGTPVDEHLNPKLSDVLKIFAEYNEYFSENCLVVMRSTIFPGTMEHLHKRLSEFDKKVLLSFCPERVSQGNALDEIDTLPQIISAFDEESFQATYEIFSKIAPCIIRLAPLEAEITKLMANAWRYLEFAIANQFYMIAESNGVNFRKIYQAIRYRYPRANGYKAPGLTAGPCLFKDTMQLASYFDHQFYMGHSAMLVNEGLAAFLVKKAGEVIGGSLWGKRVGLLGMTFKANNDDTRESLSFKLKKILEFQGAVVSWHDPYLKDSASVDDVVLEADVVILSTPHKEYESLSFKTPVIDVWGMYDQTTIDVLPGCES